MAAECDFHVWDYRSSWQKWQCSKCYYLMGDDSMNRLYGGPFEASKMSWDELDALQRTVDVERAMLRSNVG